MGFDDGRGGRSKGTIAQLLGLSNFHFLALPPGFRYSSCNSHAARSLQPATPVKKIFSPLSFLVLPTLLFLGFSRATAAEPPIHGLWVWKTAEILAKPNSSEALRDFAMSHGINEVYVSVSARDPLSEGSPVITLIGLLHRSHLRVEALLDSIDSDKAGPPRETFLAKARAIAQFNETQPPENRFDGIHLDIEPHQRAENKGAGNLQFLPGLIETFRSVTAIATPAHLLVNADIPNKVLKGDAEQRRALLTSVDRLTLMLYELTSPEKPGTEEAKIAQLQRATERYLTMTYDGLDDPHLAGMVIALRTADYETHLPACSIRWTPTKVPSHTISAGAGTPTTTSSPNNSNHQQHPSYVSRTNHSHEFPVGNGGHCAVLEILRDRPARRRLRRGYLVW